MGDGVFTSRRLSDQAMMRGLDVIRTLVTLARNKGYERIEGVATSAVREARNGGEFLDHVAQQTGLTVRVITGRGGSAADFSRRAEQRGSAGAAHARDRYRRRVGGGDRREP